MNVPPTVPAAEISGQEIARRLARGAVVILPTDTVYGLAVQPGRPSALQRVFELKGRPEHVNLPVLLGSTRQLDALGVDWNEAARRLADKLWPGPLTLVTGFDPRRPRPAWLADREEVALRIPDLRLIQETAEAAGPLLVTSANAHKTPTRTVAAEAARSLHGQVDLIVDGGTLSPVPSTLVNVRLRPPAIERQGAVAPAEIADLLGEVGEVK